MKSECVVYLLGRHCAWLALKRTDGANRMSVGPEKYALRVTKTIV